MFDCNIISGGFVLRKHFFTRTLFCSVTKNGEAESSKYLDHNTPVACYSIIKYYPCKKRKFFFFFWMFPRVSRDSFLSSHEEYSLTVD